MKIFPILASLLVISYTLDQDEFKNLIEKLYSPLKISTMTVFVCLGDLDEVRLIRQLSAAGFRVNLASRQEPENATVLLTEKFIRVGIAVDMSCEGADYFLQQASDEKLFTILQYWLLVDNQESDVTIGNLSGVQLSDRGESILETLSILPDSHVTWAQEDPTGEASRVLLEVYRPCQVLPLIVTQIGVVDLEGKLVTSGIPARDRGNLHGTMLKAATVVEFQEKFVTMDDQSQDADMWAKIHHPIAILLAKQLNFTMDVQFVKSYGWLQKNKSFDGLIGLFERREVELTATGIFMRQDRMEHVEFMGDTFTLRAAILFRQPSLSSVKNIFLLPFDYMVWISCVTICFVTLAIMGCQIVFYRFSREPCSESQGCILWLDTVTYILGLVCQQGYHLAPSNLSGRTTLFILSLAGVFLFNSYAANIVALLQTPSNAISSLTQLTTSPLKCGIQENQYHRHFMKDINELSTNEFLRVKILPQGESAYSGSHEGLELIRNGLFAFQVDLPIGYKIISQTFTEREKCGLKEIELFPLPRFSMGYAKHSSYKELLRQRLRWQREAGILNRLWKQWVTPRPVCESGLGGFVSVGLIDFYPALFVLGCGMTLAVTIFIIENLWYRRLKLLTLFVKVPSQEEGGDKMKRAFNKVSEPLRRRATKDSPWEWTD